MRLYCTGPGVGLCSGTMNFAIFSLLLSRPSVIQDRESLNGLEDYVFFKEQKGT